MDNTRTLSGYRGIRGDILLALKKAQPLSAHALADQFDVSVNALRRHLDLLEQDGVVRHESQIRGVGAPVFEYSLTPDGEALFPSAYVAALLEALETVQQHAGTNGVVEMFRRRWEALAAEAKPELEKLPLGERTQLLAELLSRQGYMAVATVLSDTNATITEHNCAIRAAAERFPEICDAESDFLEMMTGGTVERHQHILNGCNSCQYHVTAIGSAVIPSAGPRSGPSPAVIPSAGPRSGPSPAVIPSAGPRSGPTSRDLPSNRTTLGTMT